MNDRNACGECEAEALLKVWAVQDLLAAVIWNETNLLRGIEGAITGLQHARNTLRAAGFEAEP